ncbi:unnamed protein product [Prunus brigantina]
MTYIFQQPMRRIENPPLLQFSILFPRMSPRIKMIGCQWKATGHLPLVLQLQRTYFKMTHRQQTTTSHHGKTISCLHAVKIRRRKLNRFMRFCPFQLQYSTNLLLRKSFRLSESRVHYVKQLANISVPNSVIEALEDPKWKEAMNEEMRALQKNVTWELVPLPHGKKTVGRRWIYTVKLKADGSVERYKARLVAKGYTHRYRIDYKETFAPVAKINTIRVLLSLTANLDWPLHQFDVKNAFLHGDLEEEVYMDLPPGCNSAPDKKNKVCKLRKSLYGLKQSPRTWFGRFTKSMKNFGYTQSNSDHTLFLKRDEGKLTALIVYVDDIIVTRNNAEEQLKLQTYLSQQFEMKDLGDLKYFLRIEVARSKTGIFLSQRKYVMDLLTET